MLILWSVLYAFLAVIALGSCKNKGIEGISRNIEAQPARCVFMGRYTQKENVTDIRFNMG